MSLDEMRRELERIKRILSMFISQPLSDVDEPPFSVEDGVVHPLYSFESSDDYYRVLVDMPVADLDTLKVYTDDGDLVVEASLEREVVVEMPWSIERRFVLSRYRRRIPLPMDADASQLRVRVHPDRKIIEIIIPRRAF